MKFVAKSFLLIFLVAAALADPRMSAAEPLMDPALKSKGKRATDEGLRFLREAPFILVCSPPLLT